MPPLLSINLEKKDFNSGNLKSKDESIEEGEKEGETIIHGNLDNSNESIVNNLTIKYFNEDEEKEVCSIFIFSLSLSLSLSLFLSFFFFYFPFPFPSYFRLLKMGIDI